MYMTLYSIIKILFKDHCCLALGHFTNSDAQYLYCRTD